MKDYNVEPTAEIVDEMVKELVYRSQRLEGIAKQMRQKNDLTYASEVVLEIVALLQNVRIDLMTTRPLRETMRD